VSLSLSIWVRGTADGKYCNRLRTDGVQRVGASQGGVPLLDEWSSSACTDWNPSPGDLAWICPQTVSSVTACNLRERQRLIVITSGVGTWKGC
jgi:hypothetical protein